MLVLIIMNTSDYLKQYKLTHKDTIQQQAREYYVANKDKLLERSNDYYEANRERILLQKKEKYLIKKLNKK